MVKKLIALVMCLMMMLALISGCKPASSSTGDTASTGADAVAPEAAPAAADGVPAHKETLVIGSAVDINNLNLQQQQDQINNIVLKCTHETLVFFTNEGTFVPMLATEWENIDDTHIQFKLADNVTFSDGTPMTAEDVKFTLDMALESPQAGNLAGMVGCEVVDDHTIVIETESFNNEFVASLASTPFGIQSKAAYDSGMENPWYIGTGPYVFDEWVEGEYCRLKKNENYWGSNPGVADFIEFRPILEDSSRVIALQNGEVDVCINPPVNELDILASDPNVTVFERAGSRLFYFAFNVTKAPWDNKTLRQAVACAINRNDVLEVAVSGKGTPQTTILNRGLWGFYDDMEGFDYDVERAKSLMTEAGYPDGGIDTTLLIANSSPYKEIAQVIQGNLKEIGINVEIQTVDDATLKELCKAGDQDLYLWRWNEDSKVDFVYRDLFYTGSGSNFHHYSNPRADELTDLVATEKDQAKRVEYSNELQTLLVDDCPQVPLYIANLVIAYNKNLKGEYLFGGGNHDWSHAYIAE
ncbi:MAG: ABC transporter substrate-binding protein [Clostridiaceae bacterium]